MDKIELQRKYGYDEGVKKMFFDMNPDIDKGSFVILKRSDSWYWYYNLSTRVKNRTKYLCGCFEGVNSDGYNSFQKSLHILLKKHRNEYKRTLKDSVKVYLLIDEYLGEIFKEEQSDEGRKSETIQTIKNGMNRFREFVMSHDIRLTDFKNRKKCKEFFIKYIEHHKQRGMKRNTIKSYIKNVRGFLNWLCDEDIGKGILDSHPISVEFMKKIYPPTRQETTGIGSRNVFFKEEYWTKMYNDCVHKVGDLWNEYCDNGWTREHNNQVVGVGSDITYFISLFQLHSGFRMGEILRSYRMKEYWLERRNKKNSSTYWDKINDTWFLVVEDFKGKDGLVPFDLTIRSKNKPPTNNYERGKYQRSKEIYYDTQLIDVCLEMFRESPFLFSSPNYMSHTDKSYGTTYYMNLFKSRMVNKGNESEGWESYGIQTSHNLRSYFITYQINKGVQLEDLTQITRHNPQTLWKYYLRQSEQGQIKRQKMMDKSRKITKRKSDTKVKQSSLKE